MLDRTVAAFIYTNNMLDRGDQTRKGSDNALGQKLLESVKSISKGELVCLATACPSTVCDKKNNK